MDWLDKSKPIRQNIGCSAPEPTPGSPNEAAVYKALLKGELGFDELMIATGMTSSSLMSTLTVMQINKRIDLLPGKRYRLTQA